MCVAGDFTDYISVPGNGINAASSYEKPITISAWWLSSNSPHHGGPEIGWNGGLTTGMYAYYQEISMYRCGIYSATSDRDVNAISLSIEQGSRFPTTKYILISTNHQILK